MYIKNIYTAKTCHPTVPYIDREGANMVPSRNIALKTLLFSPRCNQSAAAGELSQISPHLPHLPLQLDPIPAKLGAIAADQTTFAD